MDGSLDSDGHVQDEQGGSTAGNEDVRRASKGVTERALDLIRRQPVVCILGAAALGFFVGRMARR